MQQITETLAASSPAPPRVQGTRPPVPELLAPAGDWDCVKAAVENGADAIYFGLERFNARMRARNFTVADLPELMSFLHLRGVKGYVTFNTLVFENELAEAENYLRSIIASGVDAAIVQDIGICRAIRRLSPDFPIHGSTQMTITSAEGVRFAERVGCDLVVLARECSIKELTEIRANLDAAEVGASSSFPLEVFVHGALCVAYSGQCLTSESLGGRSANRGECAQACRMPYELISDGKQVPLGDKKYLLSPQDLAGIEVLPDLVTAGVSSLKIEGRLKSPEYVANITRVYRQALDRIAGGHSPLDPKTSSYDLEMAFSRGLSTGWFRGTNNQELVHARFGKKRGVLLGQVAQVLRNGVRIKLIAPLKPGDGIVFDAGHPEAKEEGGRVYTVRPSGAESILEFGHDLIDFSRVHSGDYVWKTNDPQLDKTIRQTFAGDTPKFQRPVRIEAHGSTGQPLTLIVHDAEGHAVQVDSALPLEAAHSKPLDETRLREQLGRLGGTPFKLEQLSLHLTSDLILPVSELNKLRREFVQKLEHLRQQPKRWVLTSLKIEPPIPTPGSPATTSELIVLTRSIPQLEAALASDIRTIYCDFEDPKKYRLAVELTRQSPPDGRTIWVAPPRIFKMGEAWILKQVRSSEADGYLVRNYDHLKFFAADRKVGDFSLNVANHWTAEWFKREFNLERLTASYDLNHVQLEALLRGAPPEWFQITIHQHMPMFHMEHCVFCAFLSNGTDYRNCGRPCDTHRVELRDRVGAAHPLKADAGCRNTVYNSQAQTGAEYVESLLALGARSFRIEMVNESAAETSDLISRYQKLIRGEIRGVDLWHGLRLIKQLGVTRGQMDRPK